MTLGAIRQLEQQVRNDEPSPRRLTSGKCAVGACCLVGGGCAGVTHGSSFPGTTMAGAGWAMGTEDSGTTTAEDDEDCVL